MLIVILYYLYVGFFFQIRLFYFLQDELKQLHDECFILFKVVNCQMCVRVVLLTILIL